MRYGIFSDIHSNLEALDSVLDSCSSERIDMFFCVGDIVGYGADPASCLDRVRQLPAIPIAGNHDWAVAGVIGAENFNPDAYEAVEWTKKALDRASLTFLQELRLAYEDDPLTFVHGTLEDPAEFHYLIDEKDARTTFSRLQTRLCFVGHSHVAGIFTEEGGSVSAEPAFALKLRQGARHIVNVGSVGQPRDGDPRSAYCILDIDRGTIEIKRVAYDVEKARDKIVKAGLPGFLGDRLLYGR
jgi:diadenosine tetraphosphatase ApaH/serine/threonine PP2A family protein phosphatase